MAGAVVVDVTVKWRGTPEFNQRFPRVVEKLARDLAAQWQANIIDVGSVDTGAYLNSIEVVPDSEAGASRGAGGRFVGNTNWIVRDGVEHGIYNELGTHRMPARPALQPALARLQAAAPGILKQAFR